MTWTWVLTGLSIVGVMLNIKKHPACFYIWAVTNASWAVVDYAKGLPAQGALFSVYFLLALYGIWEWRFGPFPWARVLSALGRLARRAAPGIALVLISLVIGWALVHGIQGEVAWREARAAAYYAGRW